MDAKIVRPYDNTRRWSSIRRERDIPHKTMALFGENYCGNSSPPANEMSLRVTHAEGLTHVYRVGNDGYELWVGYPESWAWHMSVVEARAVARFILWHWWVKREWFGLRRWCWYRGLFAAVKHTKRVGVGHE